MPVIDTSLREEMLHHVNAAAKDEYGAYVTITATHDAIEQCGWDSIFEIASKKFDRDEIELIAGARIIRFGSKDCLPKA